MLLLSTFGRDRDNRQRHRAFLREQRLLDQIRGRFHVQLLAGRAGVQDDHLAGIRVEIQPGVIRRQINLLGDRLQKRDDLVAVRLSRHFQVAVRSRHRRERQPVAHHRPVNGKL